MELIHHIERFTNVARWDWNVLSLHPSLKLKVLKRFPDHPWSWDLVTMNSNFVWMWVQEFPDKPWNWRHLSETKRFNWDWVREFPNKPWNWNVLSDNIEGMTTLTDFPDKPWNWYKITLGDHTTPHDMLLTPNFPWTINELLFTEIDEETLTFIRFYRSHYDVEAWRDHTARTPWKLIKANLDLPWILNAVKFQNSCEFEIEDVRYLYDSSIMWNWLHLSEMLDFNKIIIQCMDLPWDHYRLSKNKTVSYRDVMKFSEIHWDYNSIHLEYDKKELRAADIIKKYWKKSVTDPEYTLCRKIVLGDLMNISVHGDVICEY